MSGNAAPFPAFKIDDVAPHWIPGLSRILGPYRAEFFIGQLSGQQWEFCTVPTLSIVSWLPGRSWSQDVPATIHPRRKD